VGAKDLLKLSVLQPLTAAAPLSCQDAVENIIKQNIISSSSVTPPQH